MASESATISGDFEAWLRPILIVAILLVGASFTSITMGFLLFEAIRQRAFATLVQTQFLSVFGAPICMITALVLVLMLRVVSGKIEFKAAGMEFKGASGPIVLWLLCFLALAVVCRMLWIAPAITK
jgi:hypothetical protein